MKILDGVKIEDLSLIIGKTLIISDLHLGFEEALNKQGILVPRFQFRDTAKRLEKILDKMRPKEVVITGDLKHEFGRISRQEWDDVLKLFDLINKYTDKIILVKGNHDAILQSLVKRRNLDVVKSYRIDDILILHGDYIPEMSKGIKTIVIGHEHPAVGLKDKNRYEKYKCFLVGKYKKYALVVLPSFNLVTEGTDVLSRELLSPFLQQSLDKFRVYVILENEVLDFGYVKNL